MKTHQNDLSVFLSLQVMVFAAFGASYVTMSPASAVRLREAVTGETMSPFVRITRENPLDTPPVYDDPEIVTEDELAAVLCRLRPTFAPEHRRPNHVEHALRLWGREIEFRDPKAMSGQDMVDLLMKQSVYAKSWDNETGPLLADRPNGIAINWGSRLFLSVHHDHCLACVSEAGYPLTGTVESPLRDQANFNAVLQEAIRDFRLDERETEWSALAMALWLPPIKIWRNYNGRILTFDLLAKRMLRGHREIGVCLGTHRIYTLQVLLNVDKEYEILSEPVRQQVHDYLGRTRDLLVASQRDDGCWPSNWYDGADAKTKPRPADHEPYYDIISTGHMLEWLAIASPDLHPPHESIRKAAAYLIDSEVNATDEEIKSHYTFHSHVGRALAYWRHTTAAAFWEKWRDTYKFSANYTPLLAEVSRKRAALKASTSGGSAESPSDVPLDAPAETTLENMPNAASDAKPETSLDANPKTETVPTPVDSDNPVESTDANDSEVPRPSESLAHLALGGFCPVCLARDQRWVRGHAGIAAQHDGWTYRFDKTPDQKTFQAGPGRYTPAYDGDCVICLSRHHKKMRGDIRFAAIHHGRVYLFCNADEKKLFLSDPNRYVTLDVD